jgi:Secretion system C-terminal sorting domain
MNGHSLRKLLGIVICMFLYLSGSAANRYWVGPAASNWNNVSNWSTTSGGLPGASVPGSSDAVFFDVGGPGNCSIDATVNVAAVTVLASYAGTISQNANTISVAGAAVFSGGSFAGGSANMTIVGAFTLTGNAFTSTSAILEVRGDAAFTSGSFAHNNGTVRFNGNSSQAISGISPTFFTLEFVGKANTYTLSSTGNITVLNNLVTSGTSFYNLATGGIDVKGDINSGNTATGSGGDAMININGTGTQNFNGGTTVGAGALPQLTINKASGTLNLTGFPAVSNNFTYSAGTLSAGTSTFCFTHGNAGSYTISGSVAFANVEFYVNTGLLTTTIPVATTITTTGNLTLGGVGSILLNTGNINVNGNLILANTAAGGGGSANINMVGTGSQSVDGTAVTINQCRLPVLTINKAGGTLSLLGNISFAANVTYIAGTISGGTSTCYVVNNITVTGSFTVTNFTISGAANTTLTIAAGSTLTVTGTLDLENGSNYITLNTGTIAVQGDLIDNNTSTIGGGTGTILFSGTGAQAITSTGVIYQGTFPAVTINKPSGTLTFPSLITTRSNWTYMTGVLDVTTNNSTVAFTNTLTITGSHSLNNIIIDAPGTYTVTIASGTTLTVSGNMNLTGNNSLTINTGTINLQGNLNLSNTGTGGGGSGVIAFTGASPQSINSALTAYQSSLPGITINKPSGTLTLPSLLTVRGNWTYTAGSFDAATNNATIIFGNSLTISGNHTLNNITFDGSGSYTYSLAGSTLGVSGNMTMSGAGNLIFNNGTINLSGNLLLTNTATAGTGSTVFAFVSAANQAITSTLAINQSNLPAVTINKPSGTLSLPAIITVRGNWVYTSGTLDATTNNSTVVFNNNISITGSHSLNNVNFEGNFNNTYLFSTGTVLTVNGTLTTSGSSNVVINTPVTAATAIQAQGDIIINNTAAGSGGIGTILINGTGGQNLTGNSSSAQGILPYVKIQKSSGTLSLSGTISSNRDWSYLSGTVNAGTSTIVFGGNNLAISSSGMSFNNLSVVSNTSTVSNNLTINGNLTISGAAVLAGGANTVNVGGNWSDWGSGGFTQSTGAVSLNGSGLQFVGTTGGGNFNNLSIGNSGAGIKLLNNVTVAGTLTMSQGNIDLNTNTFTLGLSTVNSGTLSRTAGTMVNAGSFVRWFNSATVGSGSVSGLFPVGTATDYRPFYVSAPVTGPATGGTIALSYNDASTNSVVSIPDGAFTIVVRKDLNWSLITGGGLAGGTFEVQAQGTGFGTIATVADLRLTQAASVVGTAGTNAGSISNPQIYRTGLTTANLSNSFYVGSVNAINSPLPITLVAFTATLENQGVQLKWETSSEVDNAYYLVQRATDTSLWKDLQQVAASGNTSTDSYYTTYDPNPVDGNNYYRLMQVDRDGTFTYSPVRQVTLDGPVTVSIYPNPARSFITIRLDMGNGEKLSVMLMNTAGQTIEVPTANTGSQVTLYTSGLAKGIYFVRITHGQRTETKKFILE